MYKHILIATDGSKLADKALSNGLALAKALNSDVTVVTVTEMWPPMEMAARMESGKQHPIEDFEKSVADWANNILSAATSTAKKMGVACTTVHMPDHHPADGIIAASKSNNCDLIVVASHGRRGVAKLLLGSVATEVLAHASVPVLIYR